VGFAGPDVDAELIALTARLWRKLGLTRVKLQINSLGTVESRRTYREKLIEYFSAHHDRLDEDCRRRLHGNPLRILDSKNPDLQQLIAAAPLLTDYLDSDSQAHFATLQSCLAAMGVEYTLNPRLVRGLDYYSRTVFEWITDALGAQDAVCSGGRYDGLITQLGGDATPAIGFALGIERVVELLRQLPTQPQPTAADVYVVLNGERAAVEGGRIVELLRDALPHRRFEMNLGGGNFKAQFRRADRSRAPLAVIIGEDELVRGMVALKPLRLEAGQSECPMSELPVRIEAALRASDMQE
jgi:histidyl-tRNA synthetase